MTDAPMTVDDLAARVASLRSVGGIYEYIDDCVQRDNEWIDA